MFNNCINFNSRYSVEAINGINEYLNILEAYKINQLLKITIESILSGCNSSNYMKKLDNFIKINDGSNLPICEYKRLSKTFVYIIKTDLTLCEIDDGYYV